IGWFHRVHAGLFVGWGDRLRGFLLRRRQDRKRRISPRPRRRDRGGGNAPNRRGNPHALSSPWASCRWGSGVSYQRKSFTTDGTQEHRGIGNYQPSTRRGAPVEMRVKVCGGGVAATV